jgi:Armadillo/beta-catenin-like repeat
MGVCVEAVAALANLAVNDDNELAIVAAGGLTPILAGAQGSSPELQSQCARALRNLSVHSSNKARILDLGGVDTLRKLADSKVDRIHQQASRALVNLGAPARK